MCCGYSSCHTLYHIINIMFIVRVVCAPCTQCVCVVRMAYIMPTVHTAHIVSSMRMYSMNCVCGLRYVHVWPIELMIFAVLQHILQMS